MLKNYILLIRTDDDVAPNDAAGLMNSVCSKFRYDTFCEKVLILSIVFLPQFNDVVFWIIIARQEPFYVWFHTDADELTNAGGGETNDNELVGFPPGKLKLIIPILLESSTNFKLIIAMKFVNSTIITYF